MESTPACRWEDEGVSSSADSRPGDRLGYSVHIANDTILVAAPRADKEGNIDVGSLRIYSRDNKTEVLHGQTAHETWGSAAALSGDGQTVAAGVGLFAPLATSYVVRVYHQNGTWTKRGHDLRGIGAFNEIVSSVALSHNGTVVAVGYSIGNQQLADGGSVSIWQLNGEQWTRLGASLLGEEKGGEFGFSIGLSADGKIVAVGAPHGLSGGSVHVFEYTGRGQWQRLGQTLRGVLPTMYFGFSLDLSPDGSTIVIGSYNEHEKEVGKVWVYTFDAVTQVWRVKGDALHEEAVGGHAGYSVSLSADTSIVAVGAPRQDNGKGRVRVYKFHDQTQQWLIQGNDLVGDLAGANFGYSVSAGEDGSRLVVGSPFSSEKDGGRFDIYQWSSNLTTECLRQQPKAQELLPSDNSMNLLFVALPLMLGLLAVLMLALVKRRLLDVLYWHKSKSIPKPVEGCGGNQEVDYCICSCSQDMAQAYLEERIQHVLEQKTRLRGVMINEDCSNLGIDSSGVDPTASILHSCQFGIVFLSDRFLESNHLRRVLNTLYHRYKEPATNPDFKLVLFYQRKSLMKSVPEYRCFRFINSEIRPPGIDNHQYLATCVLPVLFRAMDNQSGEEDDNNLVGMKNGESPVQPSKVRQKMRTKDPLLGFFFFLSIC